MRRQLSVGWHESGAKKRLGNRLRDYWNSVMVTVYEPPPL